MSLLLGKLSKDFYNKIPVESFSHLFLTKYDKFIIEKTNYTLERYPPIHIHKINYQQIISDKKYGLDFIASTYLEDLSEDMAIIKTNKIPNYQIDIHFRINNYYVKERMNYNKSFDNDWYYHSEIITPNTKKQIQNTFSSNFSKKLYDEILEKMK